MCRGCCMRVFKGTVISLVIMLMVSGLSLLLVSTLTFLFKWQADKAMFGIIATYIASGFVGGLCFSRIEKKLNVRIGKIRNGKAAIEAVKLSTIFVLILVLCSVIGFRIPFEFSSRFLLIWLLIAGSTFVGMRL